LVTEKRDKTGGEGWSAEKLFFGANGAPYDQIGQQKQGEKKKPKRTGGNQMGDEKTGDETGAPWASDYGARHIVTRPVRRRGGEHGGKVQRPAYEQTWARWGLGFSASACAWGKRKGGEADKNR